MKLFVLLLVLNAVLCFSQANDSFGRILRGVGSANPLSIHEASQQLLDAISRPLSYDWSSRTKRHSKIATTVSSCKDYTVPLTYELPSPSWNRNLTIHVCSFRRADPTSRAPRQVWLVPGGPGETSDGLAAAASASVSAYDADVYTLDFRGVGKSAPLLECPEAIQRFGLTQGSSMDAWTACGNELIQKVNASSRLEAELYMRQFRTENAAKDYHFLIKLINSETPGSSNQEIWLNGYSYGTFLVNRIVKMYPDLATHVLMDGTMTGQDAMTLFTDYDLAADVVFQEIWNYCSRDTFCAQKTGVNPQFGAMVIDKLLSGSHCKDFATRFLPVAHLQVMIRYVVLQLFPVREMLPMLMYRLNRCDAQLDGPFLSNLFQIFASIYSTIAVKNPEAMKGQASRNIVLGSYIQVNEQIDRITPITELESRFTNSSLGYGLAIKAYRGAIYPTFPGRYSDPDGPTLGGNINSTLKAVIFISGELDSQTPATMARKRFSDSFLAAPERFEFTAPQRAHINSIELPSSSPCVTGITQAFVKSGGSAQAASQFLASSDICKRPWFDYNAKTLQSSRIGATFGVDRLSDFWDGGFVSDDRGLIIGITVLVGLVVLIAIGALIFFFVANRKKSPVRPETAYNRMD